MTAPDDIKKQLYEKCMDYVNERVTRATAAMRSAQDAANEESRSSAGDKYNTGRAMMQIERDNAAKQLAEAQMLSKTMGQVDISKHLDIANLGSLVETSQGNYFIAISVGKIILDGYVAFTISPASPIGQLLMEKKGGDEAVFNSKVISINRVI